MRSITWESTFYHSREELTLQAQGLGFIIQSNIIGNYLNTPYSLAYEVNIAEDWSVHRFMISTVTGDHREQIKGEKIKEDWYINGLIEPTYSGFRFIDISLTPFTNSLPINHLNLRLGQEEIIDVIYFDILEHQIRPVKQKYCKLTYDTYRFENVPNDFEADIRVDESGLVTMYPSLFEQTQ